MIQLFLPSFLEPIATLSRSVPGHFRYGAVPHTKCVHRDWRSGDFLMQWKTGEAVDLCINHFRIGERVVLEARSSEDVFIVHFMLEGRATLRFPDRPALQLRAGEFGLFLVPRGSHCPVVFGKGKHKSCHVFLRPEDVRVMGADHVPVRELLDAWEHGETQVLPGALFAGISVEIAGLLQELEQCAQPAADMYRTIYQGVLQLFSEYGKALHKYANILQRHQKEREQARMIQAFILGNYTEDEAMRMEALARRAGFSTTTLDKRFRELYRMSIHKYITLQRIRQACTLLALTRKTAGDIGSIVGYNSPVSFHRAFIRICGCTPLTYRKKHQCG